MNHLAHALLASHADDAMVGALLGDFVKGDDGRHYPPAVRFEIDLHRRIDVYTDAHPQVREALGRFSAGRRRFAGIALDVHFDHLLARDWSRHCDEPLPAFAARVYGALQRFGPPLPAALAQLSERLSRHDGLTAYRDFDTVVLALDRIARRLSRGGDQLRACEIDLRRESLPLAAHFDAFFPALRAFVAAERARLKA